MSVPRQLLLILVLWFATDFAVPFEPGGTRFVIEDMDEAQAARIVDSLKAAGFSNNDISALLPDKSSTREFAHEKGTKAPEGAVTGATRPAEWCLVGADPGVA